MAKISNEFITDLKRKRGEKNISVLELANQTGVSRWTLAKILKGTTKNFQNDTILKLNNWLEDL